ncbi:alpha/beta fold hydrolase [Motilibacter deserti]|uniref:Alpha/beta hydrolase n=1 Tax=Motilibacter deserti TaxID=2714956 RepID=A0ABX0GXL7_9ACTN|nr:alpha/beta hydrolase [Motilibacter deserti]NHC15732.1 alpha/beta hydrolase [Motilibacter deserti]
MTALERIDVGTVTLAVHARRPPAVPDPAGPAPVLLLPGTGATADDWDEVAERLAHTRTVYAVDLRGHGKSDWPGTYSLALMADDIAGLLDRLPEPRLDVVGHSLGGLVACLATTRRPQHVRRLVLEDVGMPHPRPPATPRRPPDPLPFDWRVVEQVRPQIDDPDPAWPRLMRSISVPSLVIAGGPTSFVPEGHIAELVSMLSDAELRTVPAGHLVHRKEPEQFLAHLMAFLDS